MADQLDLPDPWRRSETGYEHAYLDCAVRVEEDPLRVVVRSQGEDRTLVTPDPIENEREARDWALAVMGNVERAYGPDCEDVAGEALARTCEGNEAWRGSGNGDRRCLLCGADLSLFGDDAVVGAGFEAHLRYVDDEAHDRAERLLDDPTGF